MGYTFRTKPFDHQKRLFDDTKDLPNHAIFWEQGCGKTKPTLDIIGHQYTEKKIDAVLVIAPNIVHQNWVDQEIPRHLPKSILADVLSYTYHSSRAKGKKQQPFLEDLIHHNGLSILAITYDGVMTAHGHAYVTRFLTRRSCFVTLDESHRIKTPGAKRTKRILSLGKYAVSKRILTGTPLANSPFDIYAPLKFLDPMFWKDKDIPTFGVFKTYFGVWEQRMTRSGQQYPDCVSYRHLNELYDHIKSTSDRVTKDEALPHLPERLYTKFPVELSVEQRELYNKLRDEFIAFLASGETITVDQAMTRMLRLQQVVCGYVPFDDSEDIWIAKDNPRMKALLDMLEDSSTPTIIYARFRNDINQICKALGDRCVRYDGSVPSTDRLARKEQFQNGEVQFFVGNPAACGEGIDLYAGRTAIYYSNSFKLTERLQSEARPHRQGQKNAVTYIDFVARGTVDEHIIKALRNKLEISSQVLGDEFRSTL